MLCSQGFVDGELFRSSCGLPDKTAGSIMPVSWDSQATHKVTSTAQKISQFITILNCTLMERHETVDAENGSIVA